MTREEFLGSVLNEGETQAVYTLRLTGAAESIKFDFYVAWVPRVTQEAFTYYCNKLLQQTMIDQTRYDELMAQCPTDTDPGSFAVNP